MIKIAGGIILGVLGLITLLLFLIAFGEAYSGSHSNEIEKHSDWKAPTDQQLLNECQKLVEPKIKFMPSIIYKIIANDYIKPLDTWIFAMSAEDLQHPENQAMFICSFKRLGQNQFHIELDTETYTGNIRRQ